ncbi:MAG: hypothetical protein KBB95_18570 [Deltaproteobacteria bacterium]|nr:hypothetical protein [Deltaproteobacteria bacterium]
MINSAVGNPQKFGAYVRVPFFASYFLVNTPEAAGPVRICPTNVLIP